MSASTPPETRMHAEAAQAPAVVEGQLLRNAPAVRALAASLRRSPPRAVVTCARGSSDNAATYARYLIETRLGLLTASAAPSVSSVYGAHAGFGGTVLLAISQSGASPDLLVTVEAARSAGARVVALVNVEDSPLARLSDVTLPLAAGVESSVAATKSYLASLAAILQLVAEWADDPALRRAVHEAPALLRRAWMLDWTAALEPLSTAGSAYVVARGVGLGIAEEWALKLKETCRVHAEALSAAELRHGPMALVRPGFPVLMLAQHDATRDGVLELARDLAARGAQTLLAGATLPGTVTLPTLAEDPALEPMLATQSFYRFANALALANGLDPDRPAHLHKVTRTL
ncbi:MAG TPA: SIS domain-containing protein [Steroidobacteraceae bacterium]|nr:SIS domain-containing protein [Steroidobacteraceae bacterium]